MTSGSASSASDVGRGVAQILPLEFPNWCRDSICDSAECPLSWQPNNVVVVASPLVKLVVAEYLDSFVPIFCSSGDAGAAYLVVGVES